jgi:hypothetical protein
MHSRRIPTSRANPSPPQPRQHKTRSHKKRLVISSEPERTRRRPEKPAFRRPQYDGSPATPSNSSWSPICPSACSATSSNPTPASSSTSEEFSGRASSSCCTIPAMSPAGFVPARCRSRNHEDARNHRSLAHRHRGIPGPPTIDRMRVHRRRCSRRRPKLFRNLRRSFAGRCDRRHVGDQLLKPKADP